MNFRASANFPIREKKKMLFWMATQSLAVKPLKMWAVGCLGSRGVLSFESWASVCKLVLWGSWPKGRWQAKMYQERTTRAYLMVLKALSWCRKRIFIGRCKSFSKKSKKNKKSFDREWDGLYILQNVKCFWLMSSNGCYRRSNLRAGVELRGCPNETCEEWLSVYRC